MGEGRLPSDILALFTNRLRPYDVGAVRRVAMRGPACGAE